MSRWTLEPGHTEAAFRARHMMVTWVRGLFKDIHGKLNFDPDDPLSTRFEGWIDARKLWTGEPTRDDHLRSPDFFAVEQFPTITFRGECARRTGANSGNAVAELTIRGTTLNVPLDVSFLGEWETPFWVGDESRGTLRRIGFEARTRINRHDFGVSWQDHLPGGGVVVSDDIEVAVDAEAILDEDLERTGAIEFYRDQAPGA